MVEGDEGTATIAVTGPEIMDKAQALLTVGDFALWIWRDEVHARLGGTYRPASGHLVPGRVHTITTSWGPDGFGVAVDAEMTIYDPGNTFPMPDGDPVLGLGSGDMADATTPVGIGVQFVPTQLRCPAQPATLDGVEVPCAL